MLKVGIICGSDRELEPFLPHIQNLKQRLARRL